MAANPVYVKMGVFCWGGSGSPDVAFAFFSSIVLVNRFIETIDFIFLE